MKMFAVIAINISPQNFVNQQILLGKVGGDNTSTKHLIISCDVCDSDLQVAIDS